MFHAYPRLTFARPIILLGFLLDPPDAWGDGPSRHPGLALGKWARLVAPPERAGSDSPIAARGRNIRPEGLHDEETAR